MRHRSALRVFGGREIHASMLRDSSYEKLLGFCWNIRANQVVIAHIVSDETIDRTVGHHQKRRSNPTYT